MDFLKTASDALFNNKSEDKETPSLDEKKIVQFVKSKVDSSKQSPARLAFESSVVTNTAYLLGYDAMVYDSKIKIFRNFAGTAANPNRGRVHKNLILPSIQNRLARLVKNPPRYDVRPNSSSEEDKEAARLSLKVLNNVMDKERYNEKRIENCMWMQQAGYSWIKTGWDPQKGKKIQYTDEQGQPQFEYEGDIYIDVVSPLEVFVDPMAKRMEDVSWLVHAKVRPLTYFRDQYEKGYEVKSEDAYLSSIANLLRISQMNNKSGIGSTSELMKNSAIELAYYEKPSKKFPEGRLIITANNVLLAYKPLPIDEIPFVKFDDVKIGGKFHSESLITHMRPLQDQMNRILRRKSEFINKSLSSKVMAAKGHGMHEEALNDTTELLEYNAVQGAEAPKQMTMPQMPQYAFQEDQSLKVDFSEIAGIGEPSKGQAPNASIPAIGMQLLVEQDDTRIGVVVESNENSHSDVGRHILKLASKYYRTPRLLKESGSAGEYAFTEVTGEMLKNSDDVLVIRGSTLPGSKTLKRQELTNLYQQGMLGDPNDPGLRQKVLEFMEFGDLASVWEDRAVDRAQVDRTIKEIEQGIPPMVHPDDNHQMHFEYKNRLRKSTKFLAYPDPIKFLLDENIQQHKQFLLPPPPMAPVEGAPDEGVV